MAFRQQPVSLEYDDEEILDQMASSYEPPTYPYGCQFTISEADMEKAAGESGKPGQMMSFSAMAEVTSAFAGLSNCRVELVIRELAGDDGKFFDIKAAPEGQDEDWSRFGCISLCEAELDKMGLEADCELGDTIHLIGEARLERLNRTEKGGDVATLQITALSCEDESAESRED